MGGCVPVCVHHTPNEALSRSLRSESHCTPGKSFRGSSLKRTGSEMGRAEGSAVCTCPRSGDSLGCFCPSDHRETLPFANSMEVDGENASTEPNRPNTLFTSSEDFHLCYYLLLYFIVDRSGRLALRTDGSSNSVNKESQMRKGAQASQHWTQSRLSNLGCTLAPATAASKPLLQAAARTMKCGHAR